MKWDKFTEDCDIKMSFESMQVMSPWGMWEDFNDILCFVRLRLPGAKFAVDFWRHQVRIRFMCHRDSIEYQVLRDVKESAEHIVIGSLGSTRAAMIELSYSYYVDDPEPYFVETAK